MRLARTGRRIAVTLTVVAAAIAGLAPGAAAATLPTGVACWWVTNNGVPIREECRDLTRPRVLPTCRVCPGVGFDIGTDVLPVDRRVLVIGRVADGLARLAEADLAADPKQAQALRLAALDAFITAARQFDGGPVLVGTTGLVDRGRFVPASIGWLAAADAHIVAGLVGAQDPDGDPVDALLAPFAEAVKAIRTGLCCPVARDLGLRHAS